MSPKKWLENENIQTFLIVIFLGVVPIGIINYLWEETEGGFTVLLWIAMVMLFLAYKTKKQEIQTLQDKNNYLLDEILVMHPEKLNKIIEATNVKWDKTRFVPEARRTYFVASIKGENYDFTNWDLDKKENASQ